MWRSGCLSIVQCQCPTSQISPASSCAFSSNSHSLQLFFVGGLCPASTVESLGLQSPQGVPSPITGRWDCEHLAPLPSPARLRLQSSWWATPGRSCPLQDFTCNCPLARFPPLSSSALPTLLTSSPQSTSLNKSFAGNPHFRVCFGKPILTPKSPKGI